MDLLAGSSVQHLLMVLAYWNGPITGDLREDTFRDALKKFQADVGLVADGAYGPKTDLVCRTLMVQLQAAPPEMAQLRRWRLTNYYVACEGEKTGPKVPIMAIGGSVLGTVSAGDFVAAALEGTIRMQDGRLLNVTGTNVSANHEAYVSVLELAKQYKWIPDRAGYAGLVLDTTKTQVVAVSSFGEVPPAQQGEGYGIVRGVPMKPFRTLAADIGTPNYKNAEPLYRGKGGTCPPGSEVFIVEFVGKKCPDGKGGSFIHDGWFVVNDTGGGIFGAHYDCFSGSRTLASQVPMPSTVHVWFRGKDLTGAPITSETRLPWTYSYGI